MPPPWGIGRRKVRRDPSLRDDCHSCIITGPPNKSTTAATLCLVLAGRGGRDAERPRRASPRRAWEQGLEVVKEPHPGPLSVSERGPGVGSFTTSDATSRQALTLVDGQDVVVELQDGEEGSGDVDLAEAGRPVMAGPSCRCSPGCAPDRRRWPRGASSTSAAHSPSPSGTSWRNRPRPERRWPGRSSSGCIRRGRYGRCRREGNVLLAELEPLLDQRRAVVAGRKPQQMAAAVRAGRPDRPGRPGPDCR